MAQQLCDSVLRQCGCRIDAVALTVDYETTRQRKANTQRGLKRFVEELLARVRRAGYRGRIVIRADSGFENQKVMRMLDRRGVEFSIAVKQHKHIRGLIDQIPATDWATVSDYPATGEAQVAEHEHPITGFRLIARRTRRSVAAGV